MPITTRTHYNPCFWTAYWNFDYLKAKRENPNFGKTARKQQIFSLNLKSDKILNTKTEDVFFEKHVGIATITPEAMKTYINRNFAENKEEILQDYQSELILDFENHFSFMEEAYKVHLEKLILTNEKIDTEYKTYLTTFIVHQILRHPGLLGQMTNVYKSDGMEKFEMLYDLKAKLSNTQEMAKLYGPIVAPRWTIYKLDKNIFPLCDSPILGVNFHIMVAVAPNIMIEIDLKRKWNDIEDCKIKNKIGFWKYRKFINRTIRNSSREIIFGDIDILKKIQKSNTYKRHLRKLNVC